MSALTLPLLAVAAAIAIAIRLMRRRAGDARAADALRGVTDDVLRRSERERARIGRELQEVIAQSIVAARYSLVALERDLRAAHGDEGFAQRLEALREELGVTLVEVQRLAESIYPRVLYELGLVPALRSLVRTLEWEHGVSIELRETYEGSLPKLPDRIAITLFRLTEEALRSILLHSGPDRIELRVALEGGTVAVHIRDALTAADTSTAREPAPPTGRFRLHERSNQDVVSVVSHPDAGTSIRARLPDEPFGAPTDQPHREPGDAVRPWSPA